MILKLGSGLGNRFLKGHVFLAQFWKTCVCCRVRAGKTSGLKWHYHKPVQRVLVLTEDMVGRCIIEILRLNEVFLYFSVVWKQSTLLCSDGHLQSSKNNHWHKHSLLHLEALSHTVAKPANFHVLKFQIQAKVYCAMSFPVTSEVVILKKLHLENALSCCFSLAVLQSPHVQSLSPAWL